MTNYSTSPLISIILPTYNRANFIIEAIVSVRGQTYSNWELLVMDDCSIDDTEELVEKINDERIQLHKTGKRLGITGTRNAGIRKSKGELIAFIDSDDLWESSKLQKQVAALNQYPDAGFSLTGGYNFRKQNEPLEFFYKQREGMKCDHLFIAFFKAEVSATTPSLIFRKECLEVTGYFNEAKSFADLDFILSLARNFKGVVLYEPLLYRRLHDSNVSNREWEKGYEEGIELIRTYKDILPSAVARGNLFRLYINSGVKYLRLGKRKKALSHFFKAWRNKPFSYIPLKKILKTILQVFRRK